ncbi:MAG: hypothetical protein Q9218_007979, partial [Villophora microphyllina]
MSFSLLKQLALAALATSVTAQFQSNVPATTMCGNDNKVILQGTPWLVANSLYGARDMQGSSCTTYQKVQGSRVFFSANTHIANVESTNNVCKGYANVGLIQNLGTTISSIASVPANYQWTRTNNSPFKGNVCFDFIIAPTKGDGSSSAAQELMLWLEWEGGQLPIGWNNDKPVATVELFDTTWKIYEGVNTGNGMTV